MGRPRPRPVADTAPFDDALETIAPLLAQLEAVEAIRTLLVSAMRMRAELPRLQEEYARLTAAVPRLQATEREWQAARTDIIRAAMALERRGAGVELPPSITGAR